MGFPSWNSDTDSHMSSKFVDLLLLNPQFTAKYGKMENFDSKMSVWAFENDKIREIVITRLSCFTGQFARFYF